MTYSFDIETCPYPDAAARIREDSPFDPSEVKCGNLKDPAKIAEKIAEAEQSHYQSKLERAALDPRYSYICALGFYTPGAHHIAYAHKPEDELNCLSLFTDIACSKEASGHTFWGWNSDGFDLPFILKRYWMHGIKAGAYLQNGRYFAPRFVDLMKVFTCHQYQTFAGLKKTAKWLGVAQPREHEVEGKFFYQSLITDPDKAEQYLLDDLIETYRIGEIIS